MASVSEGVLPPMPEDFDPNEAIRLVQEDSFFHDFLYSNFGFTLFMIIFIRVIRQIFGYLLDQFLFGYNDQFSFFK